MHYSFARLIAALWVSQALLAPAYVTEGDRVEKQFRSYREELDGFYLSLKEVVDHEMPGLLADLAEDPPPEPIVYGYGLLPPIEAAASSNDSGSDAPLFRSYSWPLTEHYIDVERERLGRARQKLDSLGTVIDVDVLTALVTEYHTLVDNQATIDQHVQYNRFWQRSVAENLDKFERLDALYDMMVEGNAEAARSIRDVLGHPAVPSFVSLRRDESGTVVVSLPVYTDIEDEAYLSRVETIAEQEWQASGEGVRYQLDLVFRLVSPDALYAPGKGPGLGEHIDLTTHLDLFAPDGAVLTTGAESTHALVGRAVLLGAGAVTGSTISHEIGHLLGFPDGYVRGYEDLGDQGYEIREVIAEFDDLMTAPATGRVWSTHFDLIRAAVEARAD